MGSGQHRADHAIFLPREVAHRGVRPVVHHESVLVFQAEGSFWCDPMSVLAGDPCHASYHAVLREYGDAAKGKPFEVCGHILHVAIGERVAWADEVAALDIEEPIWRIGVEDFWNYRESPDDESSYWVGLGPCSVCDAGLVMAVVEAEERPLVFVCGGCLRAWPTPLDFRDAGPEIVAPPKELKLANAGQVARDSKRRREILLNADTHDERALESCESELWTLRPRSSLR